MTIAGMTKLENLKVNRGAFRVQLSDDERATLDRRADQLMGDRDDEQGMSIIHA